MLGLGERADNGEAEDSAETSAEESTEVEDSSEETLEEEASAAEESQETEEQEGTTEESGLREELDSLREEVAALLAKPKGDSEEVPKEDALPEVEVGSFLSEEVKTALEGVFSVEQFEVLDTLLGSVYKAARVDGLRDQSQLIDRSFSRKTREQSVTSMFWSENADLQELAEGNPDALDFMKSIANKVESQNPTLSTKQVLNQMGKKVRKAFALESRAKAVVKKKVVEKTSWAKAPKSKRSTSEEAQPDEQQQQIGDLLDLVGG